jgi:hypothetical protein
MLGEVQNLQAHKMPIGIKIQNDALFHFLAFGYGFSLKRMYSASLSKSMRSLMALPSYHKTIVTTRKRLFASNDDAQHFVANSLESMPFVRTSFLRPIRLKNHLNDEVTVKTSFNQHILCMLCELHHLPHPLLSD